MKITELYGIIRLNVSNFEAGLANAEKATKNFRQSFARAASDISTAANRVSLVVGGMVTGIAAVTAKMGFGFNQSKDSAEIMLATILKDGALAKKTLNDLFVAAKKTPFSFEGLKTGMVQLANAKVPAQQLIPWLYKISDAVAAVGGKDEDVKGVAVALSQMMTAGRVNAQDMMQLTNRGIAGWDMLADKLGATVAEVRKAAENGAIDGRMAADLIIQAMGERFSGAGDKLSQKFQGMWSSFMDTASASAGRVFLPLYDAATRVLGRINAAMDGGGADAWLDRLAGAVGFFSQHLEALAVGSGPAALEMVVSLLEQVARVGGSVIEYLQEQGPALADSAAAWFEWLEPIFEFLAVHPELVTALLFLKGGEMLGINQALISIGSTLGSLVVSLAGVGPAFAAAFGVGVGVWIYNLNKDIRDLNEALEKTKRLNAEMSGKRDQRQGDILQQARGMDPAAAKEFLKEQIAQANRDMVGAQQSAEGAKSGFEGNRTWTNFLLGDKERAVRFQESEEAQARFEQSKRHLQALEMELARVERGPASAVGAAASPLTGGGAPSGQTLAEMLAARAAEKQAPKDEKAAAKRETDAMSMLHKMQYELDALADSVPAEQIADFTTKLRTLAGDYIDGTIKQDEYKRGIDAVKESMSLSAQAHEQRLRFDDQIRKTQEQLTQQGVSTAGEPWRVFNQQAEGFKAQMMQLAQKAEQGKISQAEFRKETEKLTDAMERAAKAARQEQEAENRKMKMRLLSGQGTSADYQNLMGMQMEAMMKNFDQSLNYTFNAMFGLGDMANQVTQGFNNMNAGMQQFGQYMEGVSGGGNAPSVGEAMQGIAQLLNSTQGAIQTTYNNLNMMQQALQFAQDPQRRAQIQREIDQLQRNLINLTRPRAPVISGSSLEVSSLGGIGTQNNKYELQFPNWSPQNAMDIRILAEAVAAEIDRRGRRNF